MGLPSDTETSGSSTASGLLSWVGGEPSSTDLCGSGWADGSESWESAVVLPVCPLWVVDGEKCETGSASDFALFIGLLCNRFSVSICFK